VIIPFCLKAMSLPQHADLKDWDPTDVDAIRDRAKGAILGMFIGDALGLGCHWHYDLDDFKSKYGEWVTDYLKPRDDSYHPGLDAGDVSQSGQLLLYLLQSLADDSKYERDSWTAKVDELLKTLDGTRKGGRYTPRDMCDVYKKRVNEKKPWGQCASDCSDTTDAFIRAALLNVRYCYDLKHAAELVNDNVGLQYGDGVVKAQNVAFGSFIGLLIRGQAFDADVGSKLYQLCRTGVLPFAHALTPAERAAGLSDRDLENLPEPDALFWPGIIYKTANNKHISIDPLWMAPQLFGLPCAFFLNVPGAYYIAAKCQGDFEKGVLNAVNSGGQNLARAQIVGAICGAIGGFSSIPARFIDGLKDKDTILKCVDKVVQDLIQNLH
jgi:ADP-ribosylglycohydrolase